VPGRGRCETAARPQKESAISSIERTVFQKAAKFFTNTPKVAAHVPTAGPSRLLSAFYGHRIRVTGDSPLLRQQLADLEAVPDPFHTRVATWMAGHPQGGIDIVDGPVTDVMPELRGVRPRGWPEGLTWDNARGLMDPTTRRVIVGKGARRLTTVHEFGHAVNEADGAFLSDSAEFRRVYDRLTGMNPYFSQPGSAGREETFASGFSAWAQAQYWQGHVRASRIAGELGMSPGQEHYGALLDEYFLSLRNTV
jgi:hypothetical protein